MSDLPFLNEVGQLRKEIPPRTVVSWILAVERHDVVVTLLHILKEDLHLLRLPSGLLHVPLHNNGNLIFWMEFGWVRQVTRVKRHLDILDVVDVLLGIGLQLLNVDLLRCYDAANLVGETFPSRILVAHNSFDNVGECGFIPVILEHT